MNAAICQENFASGTFRILRPPGSRRLGASWGRRSGPFSHELTLEISVTTVVAIVSMIPSITLVFVIATFDMAGVIIAGNKGFFKQSRSLVGSSMSLHNSPEITKP